MVHDGCKDLPRREASDKVLHNKPFPIASNPELDGYQRGLASIVYKNLTKNLKTVLLIQKQETFLRNNN